MYPSAEQLQRMIDYAAAQQRQADLIARAQRDGDDQAVWFYGLPEQAQQTLLAKQDIHDAAAAANAGDAAGVQQAVTSAVNRVIHHGAQLSRPEPKPIRPRRRI